MAFIDFWKRIEPSKKNKFAHATYDALFTFFFKPNLTTKGKGVHIRDANDLKRTMFHVVIALQLCLIVGMINVGHQHFVALGQYDTSFFAALHLKLVFGLVQLLPIVIVSNLVGLGIEFYFAARRGHSVEEGFLVSGMLIPLIMPPDVPLWMLALAVAFAVILGKEAFGGTGMNILNVALLARVFIFFAYPTEISGDGPWVAAWALAEDGATKLSDYSVLHTMFNPLFSSAGWATFENATPFVEGYSGATPLAVGYAEGWAQYDNATGELTGGIKSQYSVLQMWMGGIPGSIGETCKPAIIFGALFLLVTKVASWRIMLSFVIGASLTGLLFNLMAPAIEAVPFLEVPWYQHFAMGGMLFAMAFMATDPVTAAQTNRGKWVYGFLIGFFGMVIRVMNPAYAEGWMLAILFMNVFAPLIDHYVVEGNINKRMKRTKEYAKQH